MTAALDREAVLALAAPYHGEPFRRYHDWRHPLEMLDLAAARGFALDDGQFLAIAFHDAYCVPGAPHGHNEAASAVLMQAHARRLGIGAPTIAAADRIIRLTVHDPVHDAARLPADAALVLDLDLVRLALPWDEFERHNEDVHVEYRDLVPDRATFRRARARFLAQAFGGARPIFHTGAFSDADAKANIARLLDETR